jgi:hypothetical protein
MNVPILLVVVLVIVIEEAKSKMRTGDKNEDDGI